MRKSDATRAKSSSGTWRTERWRTAATAPSAWSSNGQPIRRLMEASRCTAPFRRPTRSRWRAEFAGSTNAYPTTSGASMIPGRESFRSANPKLNPAVEWRRTRENRYPTNWRFATCFRRKFSIGHRKGRRIRSNVAAISALRSPSICRREIVATHKNSGRTGRRVSGSARRGASLNRPRPFRRALDGPGFSVSEFSESCRRLGLTAGEKTFAPPDVPEQPPRERTFLLQHVRLEISVDDRERMISGTVTHRLAPINDGLTEVALDAGDLNIRKVLDDGGHELEWDLHGETLSIHLPEARKAGQAFELRISYDAKPRKGIFFTGPDKANPKRPRITWTQGEDTDNRYWFPSYDTRISVL